MNYLLSVLVELGVVRIPAVAAVTCGALRLLVNFSNYGLDFAGEFFACRLYPVVVARFKFGLCLCNGVFNGLFILFREFVARLFNRLFKAVYHTFEVVLVVYRLFALLILFGVALCILYGLIDILFRKVSGCSDGYVGALARAEVLCRNVYYAVCVYVEGNLRRRRKRHSKRYVREVYR